MADLGDAIYRAICNRSPNTEPNTFGQAVGWFVANAGGNVSAAARAAGVSRRTFRDWLAGKGHKTDRAGDVLAAARAGERRARLKPGREKRLRAKDPAGMMIDGTYNYDGSSRQVSIGQYVAPDAINNMVDAFLAGATLAELREVFADAMSEDPTNFYPDTFRLPTSDEHGWSVDRIDWGNEQNE